MTDKPKRIQRKRTSGWRMPANTVCVGRPTKWGNPFRPGCLSNVQTAADAVRAYEAFLRDGFLLSEFDDVSELRGKNLACWCALNQPCHADVLLRIANEDQQS